MTSEDRPRRLYRVVMTAELADGIVERRVMRVYQNRRAAEARRDRMYLPKGTTAQITIEESDIITWPDRGTP